MKADKATSRRVAGNFLLLALSVCLAGSVLADPQARPEQSKGDPLVQVEAKYVCMINNQHFSKEQIPVKVGSQTYYGCCEMCKEKLRGDARSRTATDPVSGKKIDKAKAVIGASPSGEVHYFENTENLKQFREGARPSK